MPPTSDLVPAGGPWMSWYPFPGTPAATMPSHSTAPTPEYANPPPPGRLAGPQPLAVMAVNSHVAVGPLPVPLRIANLSFGTLEILPATVYFFRGDLVIDRSKTPIPTVRCQLRAPSAPSVFARHHRTSPTWVAPHHATDDSNHSKSCRGAYTSACGIRAAENIRRVEWIYRGCISMCNDAYHIHITCSIIDLTT